MGAVSQRRPARVPCAGRVELRNTIVLRGTGVAVASTPGSSWGYEPAEKELMWVLETLYAAGGGVDYYSLSRNVGHTDQGRTL